MKNKQALAAKARSIVVVALVISMIPRLAIEAQAQVPPTGPAPVYPSAVTPMTNWSVTAGSHATPPSPGSIVCSFRDAKGWEFAYRECCRAPAAAAPASCAGFFASLAAGISMAAACAAILAVGDPDGSINAMVNQANASDGIWCPGTARNKP